MSPLPLVDQADCHHTWSDESELVGGSRLVCLLCGLTVVAYPWGGLAVAAPERSNPLGLDRAVGSSGVAGPA